MAVISVLAAGTRGDAQPPAMLCRELSRRGHEVRLIAQHEFADMIEGSDVLLKPLPGDLHAELSSPDAQKFFNGSGSPLTFLRWFYDVGKKFGAQLTPAMVDFTAGSDIVVGTGLADYFSNLMARVHKTKAAHAYMQPAVPTRAFPCALISVPPFDMPGWLNKLEARIYFEAAWLGARPIAKIVTSRPTCDGLTSRSRAMSGSSPVGRNSLVTSTKIAAARVSRPTQGKARSAPGVVEVMVMLSWSAWRADASGDARRGIRVYANVLAPPQ